MTRSLTLTLSLSFLSAMLAVAFSATPALAQVEPKLEGTHGDWKVYTRGSSAERICFVQSEAQTMSPSSVNHGKIYFMVANWKNGSAKEQPSFMAGYPLKTTRAPKARVGSTSLTMFAADNEAFISETSDERKLVAKMRAGSSMTVSAYSARGTDTRYSFSLKGITAALRQAKSACS